MAEYARSPWTTPLDDAARERLILGFQPLTDVERKEVLDAVVKDKLSHPQALRARAVEAIPYYREREMLRSACREAVIKADDLGFLSYYRYLPDALLFDVVNGSDPGRTRAYDPANAGDQAQRRFQAARDSLYKDRLADLLAGCGLKIDAAKMDDLHKHLADGKVQLDAPDLLTLVFAFLRDPAGAPKPKPSSPLTTPLPLPAALKILEDFHLLAGGVPAHVKALVRNKRISDPQALRALAVETAIPASKLRELVRTIRSTISADGGSAHLRGFPKLPETIVYEFVNDTKKTLADLCGKEIGCELRAAADNFFRKHRDELYIDRIREALSARGFALDDQRLEQTYLHMLRQRVPLPARPLPGAIR